MLHFTDTNGEPFCATKVDSTSNNLLLEYNVCPDVRKIGYDGAAQGEYCSVPFLMKEQYFETCTKWLEMPDGTVLRRDDFWCPSPRGVDPSTRLWNQTADTALCNEFLFPEDNGCEEHYEAVKHNLIVNQLHIKL